MTAINVKRPRGELVDKVGDKVQIVVEEDGRQRRVHLCEVINLLHIVEDDHHHDNHGNSHDIVAEELAHDVAVEDSEPRPPTASHLILRLHNNSYLF